MGEYECERCGFKSRDITKFNTKTGIDFVCDTCYSTPNRRMTKMDIPKKPNIKKLLKNEKKIKLKFREYEYTTRRLLGR